MARKQKTLAIMLLPLKAVLFLIGWTFYCLGLKKEENTTSKIRSKIPLNQLSLELTGVKNQLHYEQQIPS